MIPSERVFCIILFLQALVPVVSKLAVCDYAHFVVPRLLKYGSQEIKRKVIDATFGNVFSMLSRPKSTSIIDSIYMSYASSQQKSLLRQELYGDLYKKVRHTGNIMILQFELIRSTFQWKIFPFLSNYSECWIIDINFHWQAKDKNVKCIKDTYKDSPHMKLAVLNSVKSNLNHIANKTLVDNR